MNPTGMPGAGVRTVGLETSSGTVEGVDVPARPSGQECYRLPLAPTSARIIDAIVDT
jgi:hypothetical protein